MIILDELVNGKGYCILPIDDMVTFSKLRDELLQKININNNNLEKFGIDEMRKKLISFSNSEVNKVMVNLLSFEGASELMAKSCHEIINNLCGKEIFLQRRANIIFNLPGENQRRQWPHYELMSGISPFSFVLWAPLHDIEDDGGVYYLDESKSTEVMKEEESRGLVNGPYMFSLVHNVKAFKMKYGEVIVFNPFILHGNSDFSSPLARVACSIRVQSSFKPLMQKNSDFLKYYKFTN